MKCPYCSGTKISEEESKYPEHLKKFRCLDCNGTWEVEKSRGLVNQKISELLR